MKRVIGAGVVAVVAGLVATAMVVGAVRDGGEGARVTGDAVTTADVPTAGRATAAAGGVLDAQLAPSAAASSATRADASAAGVTQVDASAAGAMQLDAAAADAASIATQADASAAGAMQVDAAAADAASIATQADASAAGATRARRQPLAPAPAVPIPFVSVCAFSHRGPDDPIVKPNMPGTSHMHDFFGNVATAANSTLDSLSHTGTTCSRPEDHAAYWVPEMLVDGYAVTPVGINAYYRTGRRDPASIQPFPAGLEIVAGDSKATEPQSARVTSFGCRDMAGPAPSATVVPTCPTGRGQGLTMSIHFPDCWNGRDLDSADHQSHMAYSVRGVCPDGYPVPVPALTVHVKYDIAGGAGMTLASGPFYTAHADFFNAWDPATLGDLVQKCINAQVKCGARGDVARP